MNESTNNPLNDFLNQAEEEPENNLFAPIPFPASRNRPGRLYPSRRPFQRRRRPPRKCRKSRLSRRCRRLHRLKRLQPRQPSSLLPIKRSRRQRYSRKIPLRKP